MKSFPKNSQRRTMPALSETTKPIDHLDHTGLSPRAIDRIRQIGGGLAKYGLPPAVLLASWAAKAAILQQIQPDVGLWGNIIGAPALDLELNPAYGEVMNTLLAISHHGIQLGGVGTLATGVWEGGKRFIGRETLKKGEALIRFPKYAAIYDHTNVRKEGSYLGDFTQILYSTLEGWPQLRKEVEELTGPFCEFVTEDVIVPGEVPKYQYARTASLSNTDTFLEGIAQAQKISAALGIFIDKSYTVFDPRTDSQIIRGEKKMTIEEAQIEFDNMCESIDDLKYNRTGTESKIRRIAIVNDRLEPVQALAALTAKGRIVAKRNLIDQLTQDKYEVISAEEAIMEALITDFMRKRYMKIVVLDDGSKPGGEIAGQFLAFYEKYKASHPKKDELPEFIEIKVETNQTEERPPEMTEETISDNLLIDTLNRQDYDAMFFIGEVDHRVVKRVDTALKRQRNHTYNRITPVELLVEGRGSNETIRRIQRQISQLVKISGAEGHDEATKQRFSTYYVHEILVQKFIELLLRDKWKIDWEKQKLEPVASATVVD